jgi:TolA-binding protein
LFQTILNAESSAQNSLAARERFSRAISVLAGYAMRPQLAMAALLLLMIGSSLVFVRTEPTSGSHVSVTELGTPNSEAAGYSAKLEAPRVFGGGAEQAARLQPDTMVGGQVSLPQVNRATNAGTGGVSELGASGATAYTEAMSAYQEGRYAEAERLFSEISAAGGEKSAAAALHEGHAARNGSGCQRAAAIYDSVAERFASGTVANEASWHAASCYRAMGQVSRAAAHYRDLEQVAAYAGRAQKALSEIAALAKAAGAPEHPGSSTSGKLEGQGTTAIDAAKLPNKSDAPAAISAEVSEQAAAPRAAAPAP